MHKIPFFGRGSKVEQVLKCHSEGYMTPKSTITITAGNEKSAKTN